MFLRWFGCTLSYLSSWVRLVEKIRIWVQIFWPSTPQGWTTTPASVMYHYILLYHLYSSHFSLNMLMVCIQFKFGLIWPKHSVGRWCLIAAFKMWQHKIYQRWQYCYWSLNKTISKKYIYPFFLKEWQFVYKLFIAIFL